MEAIREDMKSFTDKFLKMNHQGKDTEELWSEFKSTLTDSIISGIPKKKI